MHKFSIGLKNSPKLQADNPDGVACGNLHLEFENNAKWKNRVFFLFSYFSFVWIFTLEKICLHLEFITPQNEWKKIYPTKTKPSRTQASCHHAELKIVYIFLFMFIEKNSMHGIVILNQLIFKRKIKLRRVIRAGRKINLFFFFLESLLSEIF